METERNRPISLLRLFLIFILLFPGCSCPVNTERNPEVEIVTSIPVETSLTGAGTRSASVVWVEMIRSARKSLDFAEFYVISEKNEPLEPVIAALEAASGRGVKIRFLIEKKMLETSAPLRARLETLKNLSFTVFDWSSLSGGVLHAKYFIVDGSMAFIGSQNFDWRALKHIHETGIKISEPAVVSALKLLFETDWKYNNGERDVYDPQKRVAVNKMNPDIFLTASPEKFNPPGIGSTLQTILALLKQAQTSVTIQLLSYKTGIYGSEKEYTELYDALSAAASRGVKIDMAVSDWNLGKPGVESIKSLAKIKGITVKVFTIPEYSNGFIPYSRVIHSKVLRIDDRISMISTSNWGHGYFYGSRNVEVVIKLKKTAGVLDSLFSELWESGYGQVLDPSLEYTAPRIN